MNSPDLADYSQGRDADVSALPQSLATTARSLSSGTMATLIGQCSYGTAEEVQADFAAWCARQEDQAQPWQDAWQTFWGRMRPRALQELAQEMTTTGARTAAQIHRERCETDWKTKRHPTKLQGEPVGFFAQTQGTLF